MSDRNISLKNPIHLLATGFGSGLLKPAPGTWGTLAAIFPYLLLAQLPFVAFASVVAVSILAGIYLCDRTSRDLGGTDHPSIVWDEFAGFWVTMLFVTWQVGGVPHPLWIAAGFLLFRLFDIVKPFPIRFLERRIPGGLGIMFDDLLAGLFAAGVLYLIMEYYLNYTIGLLS